MTSLNLRYFSGCFHAKNRKMSLQRRKKTTIKTIHAHPTTSKYNLNTRTVTSYSWRGIRMPACWC
jgi:hypothetical protein